MPHEFGLLVPLSVMWLAIALKNPEFATWSSTFQLLRQSATYGMLALGMVFVLAMRDIDLSVASLFNLSAIVMVVNMTNGMNPWFAACISLLLGAALGAFNALLAVCLRLPMIIVTLGTLSMFKGVSLVLSQGAARSGFFEEQRFLPIAGGNLFGAIPMAAVCFLVLAAVLHLVFRHTRFGYRVRMIGSNPEAAALSGVQISRTRIQVMALMGSICGLVGVLSVAFFRTADPNIGSGFEFLAIAAAIIGGTSLSGGSGSLPGAVIGALVIGTINTGLIQYRVDASWSVFVQGFVIILAVSLDYVVKRRRTGAETRIHDAPTSLPTQDWQESETSL